MDIFLIFFVRFLKRQLESEATFATLCHKFNVTKAFFDFRKSQCKYAVFLRKFHVIIFYCGCSLLFSVSKIFGWVTRKSTAPHNVQKLAVG